MTLITHSAAYATKHAARTLATTLTLHSDMLTFEEAAELGAEMRDIFASLQECLSKIEDHTPDSDAAKTLRHARHYTEDIAEILGNTYPPRATDPVPPSRDEFTRITEPGEIKTLTPGRELVVGGGVYRVCPSEGEQVIVSDLTETTYWQPEAFIEQFRQSRFGILLRH